MRKKLESSRYDKLCQTQPTSPAIWISYVTRRIDVLEGVNVKEFVDYSA